MTMEHGQDKTVYADDATERVSQLLKLRLPWLVAGLFGGLLITLFIGRFENLLESKVELAFFIPVIVYMADAVGTQTEAIFVRNLAKKRIRILTYLFKEILVGISIGAIFGLAVSLFALAWKGSSEVAITVGLAMFASISIATVISLLIPNFLYREHTDPAVGAGPFSTVIQDAVSTVLYFLIASAIIFH